MMTEAEFDALVARLEEPARRNPAKYQRKVLGLALLGSAYVYTMLAAIAAVTVAMVIALASVPVVALKVLLVVGPFLYMIVRAIWVRVPAPEGVLVDAKQAPALFAMIAELQQALRAPTFHRVLITDDFNAAVVQTPQLGIFGWSRNYLIIGLPLLKSLRVEHVKAVLAHELGLGHHAACAARLRECQYASAPRVSRIVSPK